MAESRRAKDGDLVVILFELETALEPEGNGHCLPGKTATELGRADLDGLQGNQSVTEHGLPLFDAPIWL